MATKEHPILFSGPMVRAILAGTKTQTRRVVPPNRGEVCKYGKIGDHLWVRETWQQTDETINDTPGIVYRATDPDWSSMDGWKWRPSIYMPRAASRITLEITGVRVQRLQDISAKDIIAEGAVDRAHFHSDFGKMPVSAFDGQCYVDVKSLWQSGWDAINAKRGFGWKTNPWVWVIEFRRVQP